MRTCVGCGAEYPEISEGGQRGAPSRCRDCGSRTLSPDELAAWKAIREDLTKENFVTIYVFEGPADRAMLTSILEDEGVPYVVHTSHIFGEALPGQYGYGVLLVAEDAEQRARSLLQQYQASVVQESPDPDTEELEPTDPRIQH